MKRTICLLLALTLLCGLTACAKTAPLTRLFGLTVCTKTAPEESQIVLQPQQTADTAPEAPVQTDAPEEQTEPEAPAQEETVFPMPTGSMFGLTGRDAVLFDVLPRGRGADGHRLDYQRVELRRGPRGWELFAGAAVVPPPAQSPGPAGAPPAPAGLIPLSEYAHKKGHPSGCLGVLFAVTDRAASPEPGSFPGESAAWQCPWPAPRRPHTGLGSGLGTSPPCCIPR